MKAFESNFVSTIIRFYLMMAVVIIAGFTGQWWLAVLALPIFLTGLLSIRFFDKKKDSGKVVKMRGSEKQIKEAI